MPKPKEPSIMATSRNQLEKFYCEADSFDLPRNFTCPNIDLFDVLEQRSSRREYHAMNTHDISTLLWFTQRHTGNISDLIDRVKTPVPTAGGLASVRTIVMQPSEQAWIYEPQNHRAITLPASIDVCNSIRKLANKFFNIGDGTLLLFVASRPFISEYYENPETLVLREAGVILGTQALVAEALDFSFCPLGTTAKDWLLSLLGCGEETIIPVGASVIGRR